MVQLGRPSKYKEEFCDRVHDYLAENQDTRKNSVLLTVQLPTIEGFADYLDVNKTTLYEWEKANPIFSNALDKIRHEQKKRLLNSGLSGAYNSTIAKLVLSANHGMAEKTEVKETSTVTVKNVDKKVADILDDKQGETQTDTD